MIDFLNSLDFKTVIWLIPIIFLLHELEEWNILSWYKQYYVDLPESTNRSIRIWLILVSIVGFILIGISYLTPVQRVSAFLVSLLIAFTLQNGLQHLYWTFYFRRYAPGAIFSTLLGIPADLYISSRIINEDLLPIWMLAALGILIIPGLVETVKAGNRMTKGIRGVHELGIKASNKLRSFNL